MWENSEVLRYEVPNALDPVAEKRVTLFVPKGSIIRKIAVRENRLDLWLQTTGPAMNAELTLMIIATGCARDHLDVWDYVDTVFHGPFVWHVFARW